MHVWQVTGLALAGSTSTPGPVLRVGTAAAAAAGGALLVVLGGAPVGAAAAAWRVRFGSSDASIASATADAATRTAALAFIAPTPPPPPATVFGIAVLPDPAAESAGSCSAACCADGAACAAVGACGVDARFACFRLEYWNDAAPYIASVSSRSG